MTVCSKYTPYVMNMNIIKNEKSITFVVDKKIDKIVELKIKLN